MPSTEAPTWYERAVTEASGRADDFLKWIDEIYYEDTTGEVDSPLGWVGLINIDRDLVAEYVTTTGDPWMSQARAFDLGWYIVRIDSNGLVWGMHYGADQTWPEQQARADFAEAEATYAEWNIEP